MSEVVIANSGIDRRRIEEYSIQEFFADLVVGSYKAGLGDKVTPSHSD